MKNIIYIYLVAFLTNTVNSQDINFYPENPFNKQPFVVGIPYSVGDSIYEYEWLVNNKVVKTGKGIQNFRAHFNNGFAPADGDKIIDSTNMVLESDWFDSALHVGNGQVRLSYENNYNISADSGSISFWIKYHYDITDPIYDNWSNIFHYRIDESNCFAIQVSKYSNNLVATSQVNGEYHSLGYYPEDFIFKANSWHHVTWRWDAESQVQSIFIDGTKINEDYDYVPPIGNADHFIVGSSEYSGSMNAFANIDEFRIFSKALSSSEVKAIYLYPDKDIDAILTDDKFQIGDTIQFSYRAFNNGIWTDYLNSQSFIVTASPVEFHKTYQDILLPGTTSSTFIIKTDVPCNCKADTIHAPYEFMQNELSGMGTTSHSFTFPVKQNVPYSWYVQCTPTNDLENPIPVKPKFNTRVISDFNPDYPRLMHLYSWWGDKPELMAKYDVVNAYGSNEVIQEARKINPDLKVFKVYPFAYGEPYTSEFRAALKDTAHPLFNCVICDSNGEVLDEEFWGHPMYNLSNLACVDYLVEEILEKWKDDLLYYDGIFFDRVHGNLNWMWDDMDLNRDGTSDEWYEIDNAWKAGVEYFLAELRGKLPNAPIVGNSAIPEFGDWLSGKLFEVFLSFYLEGWHNEYDRYVNEYINWSNHKQGDWNLSMISLGGSRDCMKMEPSFECPPEVLEETRINYQKMRFGLTTTLMGDGLYLYDIEQPYWGETWWYDEYDISLGQPVGDAIQDNYWIREFEKGVAIANPYSDTVEVTLNKTYWHFYGKQDHVVNNGQAVISFKLAPYDGRILLKEEQSTSNNNSNNIIKDQLIYPNPASEYFQIKTFESSQINIYNIQGQLVKTQNISEENNLVPILDLTPGSYQIQIIAPSEYRSAILLVTGK